MAAHSSVNPVFVHFTVPADGAVKMNSVDQKSASVMEALSEPNGAKSGYGVGFPENANISWKGTDVPFEDALRNVPWGEAVLCKGTVAEDVLTLEAVDAETIHGVCHGCTIKDQTVQINAAISVAPQSEDQIVAKSETANLYVAMMANVAIDEDGAVVFTDGHKLGDDADAGAGKASTVVAVSDAIDPTVINLSGDGMQFVIPKATRGFVFTVTGNLYAASNWKPAKAQCSMKDTVSSMPMAISIVDAKTAASE